MSDSRAEKQHPQRYRVTLELQLEAENANAATQAAWSACAILLADVDALPQLRDATLARVERATNEPLDTK